jgi:ligand-binding sensor domain-containing protein/signal transduction histidine kinase
MVTLRRSPACRGRLVFLLALVTATAFAATNSAWFARVWQAEEGLPDNSVTGVAQTPDGYLWVSTHSGLARFDGVRFQRVPLPKPPGETLPLARALLLGRNSQIWLALEAGMAVSVTRGQPKIFGAASGLSSFRPLAIAQDKEGAVWIGYVDGSVCRISGEQVTRFTARDGLSGTGSCWVSSDTQGRLWFGKAGCVGIFEGGRFNTLATLPEKLVRLAMARGGGMWVCAGLQLFKCSEEGVLSKRGELTPEREGTEPTVLFEDRGGNLWIGTSASGIYRYNGTNFSQAATSHGTVTCITEDQERNLWVGSSGGGLSRLRSRVVEFHGAGAGLPFETARSVCEDASGVLWAVGQDGGLARLQDDRWHVVSTNEGWSGARATCVASDRQGTVWIGTRRGGLYRWQNGTFSVLTREQGLGGEIVRGLLADRSGKLWISLETPTCLQRLSGGQLRTYEQPPGRHTIRAMAEDSAGTIWLGTSDGLLFRVDGEALTDETPPISSSPRAIRCLHTTPDGSLWIGYAGAGLGRLRQGRFSRLGMAQGLREDSVCALLADGEGVLWFAGDHGLFQVRQTELDAVAEGRASTVLSVFYGRDEGLPSLQGNYGYAPGAARSREGCLWFPMRTGLAVVHPERLQPNRLPPPVRIEQVTVDGLPVELADGKSPLRLPPSHRKLEVEFTAPSFVGPENIQFRHQLEGWETEWTEPSTQRSVNYSRLPAGKYHFRVNACNSAGIWNERGAALSLIIQPFFWQTWWFRLAAGISLAVLLAWSVRNYERRRVRRELAELERRNAIERERTRIARDIHDDLGAGLAQIGLLADLGASQVADAPKVEASFSKIGARARAAVSSLDEIVWAANPRNDSLPRLADYLCHLADECFEHGPTRCRKEVPTGLPPIPVGAELRHNLALAVKEAFANALKHSGAQTVWLRLKWEAPELLISVEDDGVGLADRAEGELADGLRNQAARMEEIGGTVEVHSPAGQGTQVLFRVKLVPQN